MVTLGTFDGVHLGHKRVLENLAASATDAGCESLLLTFYPHPRMVLKSGKPIKLLNTIEEKTRLLSALGIENLIIHPFDEEFSNMSAEDFVKKVLVGAFNTRKIIVGHDHRFGKGRTAGFEDLQRFGQQYGFEVEQIPARQIDDISVSSTKIREALNQGDVALAKTFLGYEYNVSGRVVLGRQLGRTIGFPTANIAVSDDEKMLPEIGVYAVKVRLENEEFNGMMNIGFKPTVGSEYLSLEVHLFDFDRDIYDKTVEVAFIERLRAEQKFGSLDELKAQIAKDEKLARQILGA